MTKELDYSYYLIGNNEDDYFNTLFRVGNDEYKKYTYNFGIDSSGHWEDDDNLKDMFLKNLPDNNGIKSISFENAKSKIFIIDDDAYEIIHTHHFERKEDNGNTHVDSIYQDYRVQYDVDKAGNITNKIENE